MEYPRNDMVFVFKGHMLGSGNTVWAWVQTSECLLVVTND